MTTSNQKLCSIILAKILKSKTDTYVIFYKKTCPYCIRALKKLKETNSNYKGYDINKIGGTDILLDILKKYHSELNFDPMHRTIPIIFYNGKFIGGSDELIKRLEQKLN